MSGVVGEQDVRSTLEQIDVFVPITVSEPATFKGIAVLPRHIDTALLTA